MTISSATRKAGPFLGNGVTTSFPFSFKVFDPTNLQLVKTTTTGVDLPPLVLNSDYSVALNADQNASPGGTITYPLSGAILQTGEKLTATGMLAALQGTHITNGGNFFANNIEDQMDYLTILVQQNTELLSRVLVGSATDSAPSLSIGTATQRAGKYLGFDGSGNVIFTSLPVNALNYGLALPGNTGMGNGGPFLSGAQLGTSGVPSNNGQPLISFTKYSNAFPTGAGYDGGTAWFSFYREGGTAGAVALTGYTQVDGGTSDAVAIHGFARATLGTTARVFSGWFTTHDDNTAVQAQAFGVEIDIQIAAARSHVTNTIGNNAAVGLWINNQSDAIGPNLHGTAALGITGEISGNTSQWYTGLFFQQNSIVPGGTNEAIQINGGSAAINRYCGMRLIGNFDSGIDLSGGIYSGTGAAILLGNAQSIYAIDGSAVAQSVFSMSGSSVLLLGQGASGGVELVNSKIGFNTTPVSLISGYGTPTGGSHQGSFAAGSITLPNLAAGVAQLINDLKAYGLVLT